MKKWKKTSYRSRPISSPSMMGEFGYYNHWDGFHYTTDTYAYVGLFHLLIKELFRGHWKSVRWIWLRMIWYRWHHRMCDTTDFHHEIYCMRDPIVRKMEAEYRWKEVWKDHSIVENKEHDGHRDLRR